MKTGIIAYSKNGRNDILARKVADKMGLEYTRVTEEKPRKTMTVAWDLMFNRKPKVEPNPDVMDKYDMVILFAPVWMGAAATPLRSYLKRIKKTKKKYAFVSLSGGADESNPNLKDSILKSAGHEMELIMDLHVNDLVTDKKMTREENQNYKVSDSEFEMMADRVVKEISRK